LIFDVIQQDNENEAKTPTNIDYMPHKQAME
jgi:hypothetical protein